MTSNHSSDQVFIDKLTEIINTNLGNENFGVNELVQKSGMSYYSLSKKLHEITGKTITQFIRDSRLLKALEILKSGELTAAEVAYKTGFGSATYFNTCFTEFFGFPPGKVKSGDVKIPPEANPVSTIPDLKSRYTVKPVVIYGFSGILILIGLFYLFRVILIKDKFITPHDLSDKTEKSIAIIPFRNLSDSAGNQYFADGTTEDILTLLSKVPELRVVSRTSMEQFRESKIPPQEIAKELKVNYLVEGSVQKLGNSFRIWIQLIDKEGNHLWAEMYDGKYSTDIFTFQSMVAKKVAASLDAVITPYEEERINAMPTQNIHAYELFLKGDAEMRRLTLGGYYNNFRLSYNLFDQALKIDSTYIDAMIGKAGWYTIAGNYDSTIYFARKVLSLQKDNPDAMNKLAVIYLYTDRPDSALKYFKEAIKYNKKKDYPWNHMGAGQALFMGQNKLIEALPYYQEAYEIGGKSWAGINELVSYVFLYLGDYSKALRYMSDAIAEESGCRHLRRAIPIFIAEEKYDEALAYLDSVCRIIPCDQACNMMRVYLYSSKKELGKAQFFLDKSTKAGYQVEGNDDILYVAYLYKVLGKKSEALKLLERSVKNLEAVMMEGKGFWNSMTTLRLAAAYALLGDKKKSLEYISQLEKIGYIEYPVSLRVFPGFDELRGDPEFQEIIKRLENIRASLHTQVRDMELRGETDL